MTRAHQTITATCHAVGRLTASQISRGWGWSVRHAERLADALVGEEIWGVARVLVPDVTVYGPLVTWKPGRPTPEFGALSYFGRRRARTGRYPTKVYFATECAARLFGGKHSHQSRHLQSGHDLILSEVYLRIKEKSPQFSERWVRGDLTQELTNDGWVCEPDAVVLDRNRNQISWLIEVIGSYSSRRIRGFHEFCKRHGFAYQLW